MPRSRTDVDHGFESLDASPLRSLEGRQQRPRNGLLFQGSRRAILRDVRDVKECLDFEVSGYSLIPVHGTTIATSVPDTSPRQWSNANPGASVRFSTSGHLASSTVPSSPIRILGGGHGSDLRTDSRRQARHMEAMDRRNERSSWAGVG